MKIINFLTLLLLLVTTVLLTQSCDEPVEILDSCANVTCENDGICVDGTCDCADGFSGTNCETQDLCFGINCENEGICIDGTCDCPIGFIGNNCENFDSGEVQVLLDGGKTPKELFDGNIPLDSLFGKIYQGGLIFYLNEVDGTGLVAALNDQSEGEEWGCYGVNIIGLNDVQTEPLDPETEVGARIGDGGPNTDAIIAECLEGNIAAKLCRALGAEWFLPSRGELNLMYINLYERGHGGLVGDLYWCSTELDDFRAWGQGFLNGAQNNGNKNGGVLRVRAARAF